MISPTLLFPKALSCSLAFLNINYHVTFHVAIVKQFCGQATKAMCPKEALLVQLNWLQKIARPLGLECRWGEKNHALAIFEGKAHCYAPTRQSLERFWKVRRHFTDYFSSSTQALNWRMHYMLAMWNRWNKHSFWHVLSFLLYGAITVWMAAIHIWNLHACAMASLYSDNFVRGIPFTAQS